MMDALRDEETIRELRRTVQELRERGWKVELEDRYNGLKATKIQLTFEDLGELARAEEKHDLTNVPANVYGLIAGFLSSCWWDWENAWVDADDTCEGAKQQYRRSKELAKKFAGQRFIKFIECAAFDAVHGTEGVMLNLPESEFYYAEMQPALAALWKRFLWCELGMGDDDEEKKEAEE